MQIKMMLGFPGGESSHTMKRCVENILLMMFPPAVAAAQFITGTSAFVFATSNCSRCCGKITGFAFLKLCLSRATINSLSWLFSLAK